MKTNKGFTLIELMIVIAIIAIIAAIAIPNLMQSRIRANESTAVAVIKAYTTAQGTFQVGRQGRETVNTAAGASGFCDNYRNLYYGVPVNRTAGTDLLQLISQAHADAFVDANDNSATGTVGAAGAQSAYQGYLFMSPTGVEETAAAADGAAAAPGWFATQFGQLAVPVNSTSTGTNAYYVGMQGQVWMLGLTPGQDSAASVTAVGDTARNPSGMTAAAAIAAGWGSL